MNEITRLLQVFQHSESNAGDQLLRAVYDELRRLASARMAREKPGHTLQPTALVHEAWLCLADAEGPHQLIRPDL